MDMRNAVRLTQPANAVVVDPMVGVPRVAVQPGLGGIVRNAGVYAQGTPNYTSMGVSAVPLGKGVTANAGIGYSPRAGFLNPKAGLSVKF